METLEAAIPYLSDYSYLGVFVLIVAFSFMPPLSKTLVIVAAGILAFEGVGNVYLYILVCVAALVTIDSVFFLMGYLNKTNVLDWAYFSAPKRQQKLVAAESYFRRHEMFAVFSARFLPFIRAFVFVVAGLNRMSPWRFLAADILSATLFVPVAIALGYLLAEQQETLVRYAQQGEFALGAVVAIIVIVLFVIARKKAKPR